MTDDGHQLTLAAGLHAENAESAVGVVEGDTLHQPGQRLGRWARQESFVTR